MRYHRSRLVTCRLPMTLATSLNHPQRLALASDVHALLFLSLQPGNFTG
jgi:hypothetical protein